MSKKRNRGACAKVHDKIVELSTTMTVNEMSKELGIPRNTIGGYCERMNINTFLRQDNLNNYTEQIIDLVNKGYYNDQIARMLGINKGSLGYHIRKLGLEIKDGSRKRDDELDLFIKTEYESGKDAYKIAKELGLNRKTIYKSLKESGVVCRDTYENKFLCQGVTVDKNAFKDFDNDIAACYWYGWLVTDGCISDRGVLSISLKGEDHYQLLKLRDYLGSNASVRKFEYFHKGCNKVVSATSYTISDRLIAARLTEQGLEPRKSCREKPPKFDWMYGKGAKYFWRGCIEGDGCLRAKEGDCPEFTLVGSEELLSSFREYAEIICGVKPGKIIRKRKTGNPDFRIIAYTGNDCRKIARTIFSDDSTDLFLARKKLIADRIIAQEFTPRN